MSLDILTGRKSVSLDVGTCVLPFVGLKRTMRGCSIETFNELEHRFCSKLERVGKPGDAADSSSVRVDMQTAYHIRIIT